MYYRLCHVVCKPGLWNSEHMRGLQLCAMFVLGSGGKDLQRSCMRKALFLSEKDAPWFGVGMAKTHCTGEMKECWVLKPL